jgi:cytochrome P450
MAISDSTISLDPRNEFFVQNPYPFYAELRAKAPVFRWTNLDNLWCSAKHEDVSALLRDRRSGRQILPSNLSYGFSPKQRWIAPSRRDFSERKSRWGRRDPPA